MKYLNSKILSLVILLFSFGSINAQEVSLDIVESAGGCGLATDCAADFICFDIRMTVDIDKDLDSYNIWVQYDNTVLSRISGGDDNSCVVDNGGDTDIEAAAGAYRVAGIPGSPFAMTAGSQATVHTICFSILDPNALNSSTLSVGGSLFSGALPTSITFADGSIDAVEEVTPLVLSESTISCLILPVELLSFDIEKIEPRKVLLEWTTLTEVNNDRFEIERSFDGTHFSFVNYVKGAGNSNKLQAYSFVDKIDVNYNSSHVYYRLKQVDFDGAYEYSDIRFAHLTQNSAISVYPNPVSIGEKLNINGEYSNAILFDHSGSKIMEFSNRTTISTSALPKGMYHIVFDNNHSERFIVIQ